MIVHFPLELCIHIFPQAIVMNRSHELRVASSAPVRTGYLTNASLTASYERDEVVQVSCKIVLANS